MMPSQRLQETYLALKLGVMFDCLIFFFPALPRAGRC